MIKFIKVGGGNGEFCKILLLIMMDGWMDEGLTVKE